MRVVMLTGNETRHTTISVGSQRRSRAKAKAVEQPKLYSSCMAARHRCTNKDNSVDYISGERSYDDT